GLDLVDNNKYDVVLLDLKMGGVGGDEIMGKIQESNADTRVIFITAFNDAGKTKENLLEEGAYAFVEKPVTSLKALEELINKAAESK
ncbi:MAG: response regulator, partial [Candidatus Omnitrophica bacterium]|nr:response regulator [Candidatus Omnitrophota bacterium]